MDEFIGLVSVILIFGGGTAVLLAHSPIGRAVAARLRGEPVTPAAPDPAVLAELDQLRLELTEVQERLDFAERLLAQHRPGQLPPGQTGA